MDANHLLAMVYAMDRIDKEAPPATSKILGVPTIAVEMDAAYLRKLGQYMEEELEKLNTGGEK